MSQTAIPLQFEPYMQHKVSVGEAPDMNEMIFAYLPELDLSKPIDRNQGLPDVDTWVHQQDVDQVGKMGDNALAYSVVIVGTVPAFTFNAIYLQDKNAANSCGMIVVKASETKEAGMASTKSLVQAYTGAADIAGITVDAQTWQIDYQARLLGIEEDHRLACLDTYGHTAFIDGFDVIQQADPNKYTITAGLVYLGGLRTLLNNDVIQTITNKPNAIYIDVVRTGTALSQWMNVLTVVISETVLTDYIDGHGDWHYVAKVAEINVDGFVVDKRLWHVPCSLKHKRNVVVDGRFDFWYEGTSQAHSGYGSDTMWNNANNFSSKLVTRETLVPGVDLPCVDNPTARWFTRTFLTTVSGPEKNTNKYQLIEDVRTLAGKTATLSFYAKVNTPLKMSTEIVQRFGTGGSHSVEAIGVKKFALSASWARYQVSIEIPAVSGKNIAVDSSLEVKFWFDAGTDFDARTDSLGHQSGTFDIACVQFEEGEVATQFEENLPEDALSNINRYYYHSPHTTSFITGNGTGLPVMARYATPVFMPIMRTSPVVSVFGAGGTPNKISRVTGAVDTHTPIVSTEGSHSLWIAPEGVDAGSAITTAYWFRYTTDARL